MLSNIANKHLYGLDNKNLIDFESTQLTPNTANAFRAMREAAAKENINIQICSGYRDFYKQAQIWNDKASGKRKILNKNNQAVNINELSSQEKIELILIWSALPGCSRHHWGTDIDIFDANQINHKQLQLIDNEYQQGGPCHKLYVWMLEHAAKFGFFFPFQKGLSGVSPEPWHISYHPDANKYLQLFNKNELTTILQQNNISLFTELQNQLPNIVDLYVKKIAPFKKS